MRLGIPLLSFFHSRPVLYGREKESVLDSRRDFVLFSTFIAFPIQFLLCIIVSLFAC